MASTTSPSATPVERVERVYAVLVDPTATRGAQAWFARECNRDKSIVHRYLKGEITMDEDVAAKLLDLEAEAAAKLERLASDIRAGRP